MNNKIANNHKIRIATLQSLAEINAIGDDYFFRCERFRNYAWGSGAVINSNQFPGLKEIITQIQTLYPGLATYSIGYTSQDNYMQIAEEARNAGHKVFLTRIMYAPVDELRATATKADECISMVDDEASWALYRLHEGDCHPEKWYVEEGYDKKRFVTAKLNLKWYALFRENGTRIVSSAGLLQVGNMAQLKNVQTSPGEQKKGYATAVLGEIIRLLQHQSTVKEVYLTIDSSNEKSFRLYSKLGFKLLPCEFTEIVVRP